MKRRWLTLVCGLLVAGVAAAQTPDLAAVAAGVTEANVHRHIERLAGCGSRIAGYPGHARALEYIRGVLTGLGYDNIREDRFPVAIPVDEGASLAIEATGERFTLHALWPNAVRTSQVPPDGVRGTAVDGGDGSWEHLDGNVISGSIVFMDFNSEAHWLNPAMLGARAIVFVEPEQTTRRQAETKMAPVPLNVPRFWMPAGDYARFAATGMGKQVRLQCRMPWREVQDVNLMVRLEGSDPELGKTLVCLESYYDSMSVVPSLAPGAETACGAAVLLDLARVLRENPPKCSVLFLFTGSHHVNRAGITEFAHRYVRKRESMRLAPDPAIVPDLTICLNLTSRNHVVGVATEVGTTITDSLLYRREFLRHANLLTSYAEDLQDLLGYTAADLCINLVQPEEGGSAKAFLPELLPTDALVLLGGAAPALNLITVRDPRATIDTPLDEPGRVHAANLHLQARFLACALVRGLSDPAMLGSVKTGEDRLRRFRGRLTTFDPTKSFMPDDPVAGGIGCLAIGPAMQANTLANTYVGVRDLRCGMADADGWFEVKTAGPLALTTVMGFDLDRDTGDIIKAVDLGLEGASQYPVEFTFDTLYKERIVVLFDCTATDLYDLVDPRYLVPMNMLTLFDPGNAQPFAYGYNLSLAPLRSSDAVPYATLYTRPEVPMKIGVASDLLGLRMLFLNAPSSDTKKEARGLGYDTGALRLIEEAPYRVLKDMVNLDDFRLKTVKKYGIENSRLDRLHAAAKESLARAEEARAANRWSEFIRHSRRGLGIESRAYPDVRATADDVVKGIVFYMALLLPFAFFCERLFFAYPDLKRRITAFVGFFMATYLVLRMVHPAFRIVETSEVILLGLIILALCGIVVVISSRRFENQMRSLKQRRARVHETDVSRAGATATAFALGVSNMRRRKVRTLLTCIAVILLMFTVLSFTSVQTFLRPRKLPRPNAPLYEGALIRDRAWVPLKYLALDHLGGEFSEARHMVRRSWLSPRAIQGGFTQLSILLRSVTDGGTDAARFRAFALAGFEPEEPQVSGIDSTLKWGRWFEPGERDVCVLPDNMAAGLGIGEADMGRARVHLLGMVATVVGVVDAEAYNGVRDLDNERLTPLDYSMLNREALGRASSAETDVSQIEGRATLETFVHLDARNTVLMPYETVLDLNGSLMSVAVTFDGGTVSEHVERLLDRMAVTVFVGEGGRTTVFSSLASSAVGGMGNVIVPILIAALMVLNTMSGSVHERFKEIGTYSSVGLAPSHIGALFLAEACVYAILGGIAGYVIGQVVTQVMFTVGGLKGLSLNYSSLASVLASAVVMATVVLSTLYPAHMASRLAVPDVTRRWKLPGPEGDDWRFNFPFTVGGKEVAGLFMFFRYYFVSYEEQSVGRFYTADNRLSTFSEGGAEGYQLAMRVWLAPYDLGVSQELEMRAVPAGDFGVYEIQLRIRRLSGQSNTWVRINRGFLNEIRKQFLLWRTIAPEDKESYFSEAKEAFA